MPFRALDPGLGIIGRARIMARDDRALAQRRAQRALETIDPERVTRREILIVRRLHERLSAGANEASTFGGAATGTLAALRHRAVRAGAAARGADAVLFESHEELLLHLALDLAAGDATDRWYWRELRSAVGLEVRGTATGLLIAEARSAPAVVSLALARGELATLASTTTEEEAWLLIDALGVASTVGRLSPLLRPAGSSAGRAVEPAGMSATRSAAKETFESTARAPAPAAAPIDAADVAEIIGAEAARELMPLAPAVRAAFAAALSLQAAPGSRVRMAAAVRAALSETRPRDSEPTPSPGVVPSEMRAVPPSSPEPAALEARRSRPTAEPTKAALPHIGQAVENRPSEGQAVPESDTLPERENVSNHARPDGTRVGLAGVFFLIPLMGAHAARVAESSEAGGWEVFRSAAWHLSTLAFRGADDAWRRDLIWTLPLVTLSGAAATETGSLSTAALRQLGARWPTTGPRQLRGRLRQLIERPGVVRMTKTHVDVVFRLDQADLDIRRAGLDIDPGWVPWLGRVITFVYE